MTVWRKCSVCKKDIGLGSIYQKCSVSTCHKNIYCSVNCWDTHVPVMNHKSAWAEEETAPKGLEASEAPRRIIVSTKHASTPSAHADVPQDVLIVASKLKAYIKAKADMNTSANVMERLSQIVRDLCDDAVMKARQDNRKTVMDRDF